MSALLVGTAGAATLSVPFLVTVQASTPADDAAYCTRTEGFGVFAATVTIVCRTGAVVDVRERARLVGTATTAGGAYGARQLVQLTQGAVVLGTVDAEVGTAQLSQWRVIESGQRDYVEVGVAW